MKAYKEQSPVRLNLTGDYLFNRKELTLCRIDGFLRCTTQSEIFRIFLKIRLLFVGSIAIFLIWAATMHFAR